MKKVFDDWWLQLDKVTAKIKEVIGIEKLDDTKILIDTVDILSNDIILKNVVILITCVTRDDGESYQEIFLEE